MEGKCICLKNVEADHGLFGKVWMEKDKIYDYKEFTWKGKSSIMVSPRNGWYSSVNFSENFLDLSEYRENKLEKILE